MRDLIELYGDEVFPPGLDGYEKQPIPPALRWEIWRRDNFTCHYCGDRTDLAVDHVIPEVMGGTLDPDNLVTACATCNSRKGVLSYRTFISRMIRWHRLLNEGERGLPPERMSPEEAAERRQKRLMVAAGWIERLMSPKGPSALSEFARMACDMVKEAVLVSEANPDAAKFRDYWNTMPADLRKKYQSK